MKVLKKEPREHFSVVQLITDVFRTNAMHHEVFNSRQNIHGLHFVRLYMYGLPHACLGGIEHDARRCQLVQQLDNHRMIVKAVISGLVRPSLHFQRHFIDADGIHPVDPEDNGNFSVPTSLKHH